MKYSNHFASTAKSLALSLLAGLFVLGAGLFQQASASHLAGVSPWIECLGGCTYRVHWYEYSHCSGLPFNAPAIVWSGQGGGCTNPLALGAWSPSQIVEVTPIAPGIQTTCTQPGAPIDGINENYSYRDYDFCSVSCTVYNLTWNSCCRNAAATNVVNPGTAAIYISNLTVDLAITPCNSSPSFDEIPVIFICQGVSSTFNMGATDADGDSLVYLMGSCMGGAGAPLVYNFGYSVANPFGPSWDIELDPVTGIMHFGAVPGNMVNGPICIYVEEYRNGVKIGEIVRDMLVNVITCGCAPDSLPAFTNISNLQGGVLAGGDTVYTAAGADLCFWIKTDDVDNQLFDQSLTWDGGIAGGVFSDTTGTGSDTVIANDPIAQFCWTAGTAGTYSFNALVRDACNCCITNVYNADEITITVVVLDTGLVWPGDADNDLIADYLDVLALGVAFGSTGPARPLANISWSAQPCTNWAGQLGNGTNYKFTDCNGDAVVNAGDTTAIVLNYGFTHNKSTGAAGLTGAPELIIAIPMDTVNIGDTVHAPILLGSNGTQAANVYGVAFSLSYDPNLVDSASVAIDFNGSWLGAGGSPLSMDFDFYQQGRIDAAHVRTDQTNTSGYGQIGTLHFIITDNIDGKTFANETLHWTVNNVRLINLAFADQPVAGIGDSVLILDPLNGITYGAEFAEPHIYPNPVSTSQASNFVTISWPGAGAFEVNLRGIRGENFGVWQGESNRPLQLATSHLSPGIYLVQLSAKGRVFSRKLLLR